MAFILGYSHYISAPKVFFELWIVIHSTLPCRRCWWCHWLVFLGFSSQLSMFSLADLFHVWVHYWFLSFKYIPNCCIGYVYCLSNGCHKISHFSQLQNALLFFYRELSGLYLSAYNCWCIVKYFNFQCMAKSKRFALPYCHAYHFIIAHSLISLIFAHKINLFQGDLFSISLDY